MFVASLNLEIAPNMARKTGELREKALRGTLRLPPSSFMYESPSESITSVTGPVRVVRHDKMIVVAVFLLWHARLYDAGSI